MSAKMLPLFGLVLILLFTPTVFDGPGGVSAAPTTAVEYAHIDDVAMNGSQAATFR